MAEQCMVFEPGDRFVTLDEHGGPHIWTVTEYGLIERAN